MAADLVLLAQAVVRRFSHVTALNGVSLSITAGENVALLGPNGAGKSTFLRTAATLLQPTRGSLSLFGLDVRTRGVAVRRRIGFLGHDSFLYPDLTPRENLEFYARMFRLSAPGPRITELLTDLGLTGWANRPVRGLSRGLSQRCALARTLLHSPDLLLLDEPFTGLDVDAADALESRLQQASREGTTVMLATHDLERAERVCNRVIVLQRGRVAGDEAMSKDETLARVYTRLAHSAPPEDQA